MDSRAEGPLLEGPWEDIIETDTNIMAESTFGSTFCKVVAGQEWDNEKTDKTKEAHDMYSTICMCSIQNLLSK